MRKKEKARREREELMIQIGEEEEKIREERRRKDNCTKMAFSKIKQLKKKSFGYF